MPKNPRYLTIMDEETRVVIGGDGATTMVETRGVLLVRLV